MSAQEFTARWPHIARFLRFDSATGRIHGDCLRFIGDEDLLDPPERAAALDEWADFYEWRLAQQADEPVDRVTRHLVEEWTDDMAYLCRRRAATARGEDPGPWTPQPERRPDLEEERRAIVAKIVTELDSRAALTG